MGFGNTHLHPAVSDVPLFPEGGLEKSMGEEKTERK